MASAVEPPTSPPTRVRGVLFDIDGTLVHSDPVHFRVFQEMLLEEGFQDGQAIDWQFFRSEITGRQNKVLMRRLFPDWPQDRACEFTERKEARFRELAAETMKTMQMPGLDRLKKWVDENQLRKCAVTNAPRLNAEAILQGIGYRSWFQDDVIIGDECERAKPDPLPYQLGAARLGLEAGGCLVFEDSPSGARAGHAAGAFVIGLNGGSGLDEATLREAGCSLVVRDFEDPALWVLLTGGLALGAASGP